MILKTPVTKKVCIQSCVNISLGRRELPSSGSQGSDCLQKLNPVACCHKAKSSCDMVAWFAAIVAIVLWSVLSEDWRMEAKSKLLLVNTSPSMPDLLVTKFWQYKQNLVPLSPFSDQMVFCARHPAKRNLVWKTVSIVRSSSSGLCHCLAHNIIHCAKPFSAKLTWLETYLHKHQQSKKILWQGNISSSPLLRAEWDPVLQMKNTPIASSLLCHSPMDYQPQLHHCMQSNAKE